MKIRNIAEIVIYLAIIVYLIPHLDDKVITLKEWLFLILFGEMTVDFWNKLKSNDTRNKGR